MTAITRRALAAGALLPLVPTHATAATTWDAYVYNPVASIAAVQSVQRLIDTAKQKTSGERIINLHLGGILPINATNSKEWWTMTPMRSKIGNAPFHLWEHRCLC